MNPDRLEALVFLESAGRPEAQAPGGVASATGLTQILAETATGLLGMKVDQAKSASYTRRLNTALRQGNLARAAALEPGAAARRRPLRPRQGAGRDRALPEAGAGALRARGPRVRLLPHGDREPRERPEGVRRRPALLRGAVLRLDAAAPPEGLREARELRRRLLQLLLEALGGDGDHADGAARQGPADPARGAADRRRLRPRRAARRRAVRRPARAARRRRGHVADDRAAGLAAARGARRRALRRRPGADDLQGARAARDRRRRRRLDVPRSPASTPPTTRRRRSSTFSIACKFST